MVEQLFGSKTRVKLLKLFVNNPNRPFYVREITRKIDEQINSVRRELANLLSIGIIKSDSQNNKLFYEVNQKSKFYDPMCGLFEVDGAKATGKTSAKKTSSKKSAKTVKDDGTDLVQNIKKLGSVHLALLTGSFTHDKSVAADILLVGDINKTKTKKFVAELEKEEGRELQYVILKRPEYDYRLDVNDRFLSKILDAKYTVLIDDDNLL